MKVLTNIPDPLLIHGVASLLVRALATDPGEVFLVSPWLRNVRLPIADVGSFRAALGGDLDEIPLADLLERVAHRHSLYLITKPPAELVNIQLLRRIMDKQTARRRIVEHADLAGLDLVDELTSDIDNDVRELALSAANHVETLRIVHRVCAAGARVAFLDRLHAKLLWTPQGVLVGSANFTNGGLGSNDELMLEVTDSATHTALLATIRLMGSRAVTSENYRLVREIAAVGLSPNDLLTRALEPRPEDPPPLTDVLALIAPFLHGAAR